MLPANRMELAFSILRDVYKLTENEIAALSPEALARRLQGIHHGWNVEHEFGAIASWLGHCKLVTHPDEVYSSDGSFRVPDFLIVSKVRDREIPFLVEVKTTENDQLVWSEKYRTSILRFAELLKMPVLVAWKRYGLWTLCDTTEFRLVETAYHLSWDSAIKNNLMTVLCGNVFITVNDGFRFELKYELLDEEAANTELLPEGQHRAQIVEAGLYTPKGRIPSQLSSELFPLFLTKAGEPTTQRDGKFLRHIFPVDPEGTFNLSDLLFTLLTWNKEVATGLNWIVEIRKGLPKNERDLHTVLREAIDLQAVRYVLEQQPERIPTFLDGLL